MSAPSWSRRATRSATRPSRIAGLKAGDTAIVLGPFDNESRGARERGTVAALEEAGVKVVQMISPPEWAADPNLAIPVITAATPQQP